ncbi:hypothetical protein ACPPVV_18715 [Rhodanobacter sp. Col0626]|uniref:hypothetical protein n=1 Tax=Rhodanobacter sp. Col0626 TaxID=3415679 RepID=UPI003CF7521F
MARINQIKVIGWFWLLLAGFWLLLSGLSVSAMFSSSGSLASQHSEWSPVVAALSVVFPLLFLLSGLALVRRWRFVWWWQIPAVLAIVGICYIIFCSGLHWRVVPNQSFEADGSAAAQLKR